MKTHLVNTWMIEYWQDHPDSLTTIPIKIPYKHIIEMFCDMVSTGKVYLGDQWDTAKPLEYYVANKMGKCIIHPDSERLLLNLMINLYSAGSEKAFIKWYRKSKKSLKKSYSI